jgi:hypothetical protein
VTYIYKNRHPPIKTPTGQPIYVIFTLASIIAIGPFFIGLKPFMESTMQFTDQLDQTAAAISNAIVELVERTDGPVTLAQIAREIPDLAANRSPGWKYAFEHSGVIWTIWSGMSKAGSAALRNVTTGYKVAVQLVNELPYIAENCMLQTENWMPIVLLPKRTGNLRTPNWLLRASPLLQERTVAQAAEKGLAGYGSVTPRAAGFTADRFASA